MAKMNIDLKKSAMLALPVTLAVWLVSWLFSTLNIGTVKDLFVSVPATSGITPTVGNKVLGFIGGVLPISFDFGTIVATFISAWVAIILGTLLVAKLNLPTFKSFMGFNGSAGKIASYIMYGAIPVYLVLTGLSFPSVMTVVGLLIHTILVSIIAVYVANKVFKMRV